MNKFGRVSFRGRDSSAGRRVQQAYCKLITRYFRRSGTLRHRGGTTQLHQLHIPFEVVSQVAQPDAGADSSQTNILQLRSTHTVLDVPEDVFDPATHLRLDPIDLQLQFVERTVASALFVDVVVDPECIESLVCSSALVGAVGKEVFVLIARSDQIPQRLRAMHGGVSDCVVGDEHRIGIGPHMVLVAEVRLLVFLHPTGIQVFLPQLVRLALPRLGNLPFFDHLVLLPIVTLTRQVDKTRIHYGSGLGDHAVCFQNRVERFEQGLDHVSFPQRLSKTPDGGEIRHRAAHMQPEKPLKRATVIDLILDCSSERL